MQMTNLKVTLEPETTLFKEEVDAIIAVVMNTIDSEPFISDIHNGSFLFYGMADGDDEPQKISRSILRTARRRIICLTVTAIAEPVAVRLRMLS